MAPSRSNRGAKRGGAKRSGARGPSSASADEGLIVNGWVLLFHPALVEQLERLTAAAIADLEKRDATGTHGRGTAATANDKVVSYLYHAMFEEIPQAPASAQYQQGNTLGPSRRHWRRDKFGAGRFRLFFRYMTPIRTIVYGWVNDQNSLRTYGSSTDAYRRFGEQLDRGHPPDDWDALVEASRTKDNRKRLAQVLPTAKRLAD